MTAGAARTESDPLGQSLLDHQFDQLQALVYRRTGIRFGPTKRYFVDKRIRALMTEYGTADFDTYFDALRRGHAEVVQDLVNALTVNETYFLREDYQFDCLVRSVLPQVLADRARLGLDAGPIRILSLPAATGEEPYSIAIRLLEDWPPIHRVDVTLTGADIDTRVLARARDGRFGERSVGRIPDVLLRRYFERVDAGPGQAFRVGPDLRGVISFVRANVCDASTMGGLGGQDVIFCRNLLIYFDAVSARLATDNLFDALRPGGFLFLGHSESMSRISPIFTPRRYPEALVYQKPETGRPPRG
jgi:chemotaxis protein methyltransferase CheR